jgi:hypothetical protein
MCRTCVRASLRRVVRVRVRVSVSVRVRGVGGVPEVGLQQAGRQQLVYFIACNVGKNVISVKSQPQKE